MSKTIKGNKLPWKLKQKMHTIGEQIRQDESSMK